MTARVFISYCHDDVSPDNARLALLLRYLKEAGGGQLEILVDTDHALAEAGSSLSEFIKQVDQVDAVILLATPGYKKRVKSRGPTGVYSEFRRILNRYKASIDSGTHGKDFLLLPTIFISDFDEACPEELRDAIFENVSWISVIPDSDPPKCRSDIELRLRPLVRRWAGRISAVAAIRGPGYADRQRRVFRFFLFQDTKSRWDRPENYQFLRTVFVKTHTYYKVRNQEVRFLVGRKGAGKSAITHVLPLLSEPLPTDKIRIEFDDMPFPMCFNLLQSTPGVASDLRKPFNPLYSYQLVWDGFLHLLYAWSIRYSDGLSSRLKRKIDLFYSEVDESTATEAEVAIASTRVALVTAFEKMTGFVTEAIRSASGDLSGIVGRFSPTPFRKFVFGASEWNELARLLGEARKRGDRILVTADGFDVMVGHFATSSDDKALAREFEVEMLLALSQIVLNDGPVRAAGGDFYSMCSYCIAVPYDRFVDVRAMDYDRYRYRHKFSPIAWSGMELSALARKRLAILRDVEDRKSGSLESRLDSVMKVAYEELPNSIVFQYGAAHYTMPLFIYILRHTFWRPRDILFYYAALLAASDNFRKKNETMSSDFVRQVIAGNTGKLVEDEFVGEIKFFGNFREVLARFRNGPPILDWTSLKTRIGSLAFEVPISKDERPDLAWKVEVLYELGMLGVRLDANAQTKLSSFKHAFSFNEDSLLEEKLERESYPELEFLVHPVFCEYLRLDMSSMNELLLPFTWEYLHTNEVLRGMYTPS